MPDPRLDELAKLAKSEQIVPTRLSFVDIAGLVQGASKGEGLGNQFLATIREVDAIAHVVRCFKDDDVTHVEGRIDPVADIETIETELMLADLDSLEKRTDALEKRAKGTGEEAKEAKATLDLIERALKLLRDGKPARFVERKPEEEKAFHQLGLLTAAPVLYVCNVEEARPRPATSCRSKVEARAKQEGAGCVVISAKIESEIAALPAEEREHFLADLGLKETGLDRLIRAGYDLLHLVTYFTAGPKESRAWTITKGTRAPQAAGVIHSDFERGFIRSETISYGDYVKLAGRPARATPASCGWKARTMSSPTATSCTSGSLLDFDQSRRRHCRRAPRRRLACRSTRGRPGTRRTACPWPDRLRPRRRSARSACGRHRAGW